MVGACVEGRAVQEKVALEGFGVWVGGGLVKLTRRDGRRERLTLRIELQDVHVPVGVARHDEQFFTVWEKVGIHHLQLG